MRKRILISFLSLGLAFQTYAQTVNTGADIDVSKEESTASISTVNSEDIMKSSALNLQNALIGKGLGLTSMEGTGNIWDNNASFSIRGLQSLSGSGILILVDGIQRPINDLSTEEVESVSILKDAAAVALYGYRGRNGVLSVKTKRGEYNKMDIKFSYDHAFTSAIRLPEFVDATTYANAINEAYANDGKSPRYNDFELNAFKNQNLPYMYPDVDWVDATIGDPGYSNNYNLSFRGGGTKMRYYTLLNLVGNSGFMKNTETNEGYSNQAKYSKANIRTNLDIDLTNTTKFAVNIFGVIAEYNHSSPWTVMKNCYYVPSAAYPIKAENGMWGGDGTWTTMNPVAVSQATGYSRSHTRTLMADAKLTQKLDFFLEGLSASLRIAFDSHSTFWEGHNKKYMYASDRYSFNNGEPDEVIHTEGGEDQELSFSKNMNGPMYYNFNTIGSINYNKNFGKNSLFTTLRWDFTNYVQKDRNNTINEQNFTSYTNYGYNNKYFADLALVYSGSNRLPDGDKFTFSPTVSAAWIVSRENFLKNSNWLNFLKVRASAGILHSDYMPAWDITTQMFNGNNQTYWFTDNYTQYWGVIENRLATENVKKERAIKYNFGIEMKALDCLSLTTEAYYQKRDNIMIGSSGDVSSVLGATPSYKPEGRVDSKGIEIGLDFNKTINDITVTLGGNFTYTRNKIKKMNEAPVAYPWLSRTGQAYGKPFGLKAIGLFSSDEEIANSPKQLFSDVQAGDIKYKDQNNDGFIDKNDMVSLGYNTAVPEIYYTFNLGFEYKGIGIDALFQGVGHYNKWLNTAATYRPLANNANISTDYYENRWTPTKKDAKYPRLSSESVANNTQNSSLWLANASFLKLRQCEVYYKIPKKLLKKISFKQAKVYVRGMNLFSIDHIHISDPESLGTSYPEARSINLGISASF